MAKRRPLTYRRKNKPYHYITPAYKAVARAIKPLTRAGRVPYSASASRVQGKLIKGAIGHLRNREAETLFKRTFYNTYPGGIAGNYHAPLKQFIARELSVADHVIDREHNAYSRARTNYLANRVRRREGLFGLAGKKIPGVHQVVNQ
jgi:hypothetical protein